MYLTRTATGAQHEDELTTLGLRAASGDVEALHALLNHQGFIALVLRICYSLCKGCNLVEPDVLAQEFYMRVFIKIQTYKGDASLEWWARVVIVNLFRNLYHAALCRPLARAESLVEAANAIHTQDDIVRRLTLCQAYEKDLCPEERQILRLRWEGHTMEDIAETYGHSPSWASKKLKLAYQKLQDSIRDSQ
jgi:RNA polymerase sigma factor (sigma-70 family)